MFGKARMISIRSVMLTLFMVNGLLLTTALKAQVSLDDIQFVSMPGGLLEIELEFTGTPPEPQIFEIEMPPRLVMDFNDVTNRLPQSRYPVNARIADSVTVVSSAERTRMIVNLSQSTAYISRVQGNSLLCGTPA